MVTFDIEVTGMAIVTYHLHLVSSFLQASSRAAPVLADWSQ